MFFTDHLNQNIVNKTTCRTPSANPRQLWTHLLKSFRYFSRLSGFPDLSGKVFFTFKFNRTSKYFSFFNNKPPASWAAHIIRDFLTCYSCSYYSFMHQYNSTVIISKIFIISIIFGMKESKCKRKKNYRGLNPLSAIPTKWSNIINNSAVTADKLFEYAWPFCGDGA